MVETKPQKYWLKVTAGESYDKQEPVHVNTAEDVKISTKDIEARIHVRIKNFRGPPGSDATTSPYFSHPSHLKDLYSIAFTFSPKSSISGNDLVFGNDLDHAIRDRLPPLFTPAFNYVKKFIDPGLYGDPLADEPYLYGPLLSSINILRIGDKDGFKDMSEIALKISTDDGKEHTLEEGADGEGAEEIRKEKGMPAAGPARMKYYLQESHKQDFEFEEGRAYACDFFNPYLDFSDFAVKLPLGLSINVLGFWDGQALRYVLRNRKTNTLLFVISFTLVATESSESTPAGSVKGEKEADKADPPEHEAHTDQKETGDYGFVDEGVD